MPVHFLKTALCLDFIFFSDRCMLKICASVRNRGKQLSLEAVSYISAHTWAVSINSCYFAVSNDKRKVTKNINNNMNRFCRYRFFVLNNIYWKAAPTHLVPLVKGFEKLFPLFWLVFSS